MLICMYIFVNMYQLKSVCNSNSYLSIIVYNAALLNAIVETICITVYAFTELS